MLQGVKRDSSILKLETILKSRYGAGFELKSVIDVDQVRKIDRGGLGFALIGDELHIPLRKENAVLGTVVVNNAKELTSDSQGNIADLVKMALEPQVYKWHLDNKEANLKALLRAQPAVFHSKKSRLKKEGLLAPEATQPTSIVKHLIDKNESENGGDGDLISLASFKTPDSDFEVLEIDSEFELPRFIAPSILLRSESAMLIHKTAVQIHEYSERWAMIPFKDISDQVQEVEDLQQMGAVTLFIRDVLLLNLREQKLIAEYLETRNSAEQPLVLVGTQMSNEKLIEDERINKNLMKLLLKAHLQVDSLHSDSKGFRGVIELLFVEPAREKNLDF